MEEYVQRFKCDSMGCKDCVKSVACLTGISLGGRDAEVHRQHHRFNLFSMLSACFHLFAMRRGAFIVGAERQTLLEDFRQLPRIIFDFLTCVPRAIRKSYE